MLSTPLADSNIHIETPMGIELAMPLADPIVRGFAFAIDFIIRVVIVTLFSIAFSLIGGVGNGLFYIILFVIWWGYYMLCEMLMDGTSPGKRIMCLRVVNDDFTAINLSASFIRNLLRSADMLPGFYGLAIITMLFNRDNKRLGDMAAKTIVVSTKKQHFKLVNIDESALSPTIGFTQVEQRSIIEFSRFCEYSSADRTNEIAQHLSDGLDEPRIDQLVIKLRRYAKWFLGEN